ncbi:nucleotidyltransferase family protein [Chachezhania sediminis]|uniref:nucleotidyltransferase family protein n=1 Tax=Chachezhania sediminis TaxID=2599291 RepID=UPI00131E3CB0|nr:nucleotidyltransferase family protein [Chachezhania sediminis]
MLFAAGFGTRMGALTQDCPKPLIHVSGRPLLDHALDLVAGAPRIVVNTHYKGDQIAAYLAGRDILISDEQPEVLDTGGGLRLALPLLGAKTVITTNSDAVWAGPNPVTMLAEAWDPEKMDALAIVIPRDRAVGHKGKGDFLLDADGRIARGPGGIYGGVQILKTGGLDAIPDKVFSLNRLWDRMLADGRMYGLDYPGHWCDVGHPEGIALAERMLQGDV